MHECTQNQQQETGLYKSRARKAIVSARQIHSTLMSYCERLQRAHLVYTICSGHHQSNQTQSDLFGLLLCNVTCSLTVI